MGLGDNLRSEVRKIIQEGWVKQDRRGAPQLDDLKLSNDAVTLEGTILYADLDDSTKLVDTKSPEFAAEVYKSYLVCVARIIRSESGTVTAYDGDRIMAVYTGGRKDDRAARTALKINFAVQEIINPAIEGEYPASGYSVRQVVGIDTSDLFVARTGIRGFNELVWVGRAANYAAKLSGRSGAASQITTEVHERLSEELTLSKNGQRMWTPATAYELGHRPIYTSMWCWRL